MTAACYLDTSPLEGRESRFEVYSDKFFHIPTDKMRSIRGIAKTGEKITVCEAIGSETSGSQYYHDTTKHFISLYPNYVAIGPRHLEMNKNIVSEIVFSTTGSIALFYDLGAFGSADLKNIKKLLPRWAKKDRRKIGYSRVYYYIDRGSIFSIKTKDIEISAFNGISSRFPSPIGINLTNEVRIQIKFKRPVLFENAIKVAHEFRGFCEILS